MPGIFQTLDIARRAIWANRLGVDVASHNIANANTPGYSRQRVNLEAATPIQTVYGQLGLGVKATDIERMRSQLLDRQFRTAQQGLGKNQIKENTLYQVETILQEPSENSIGNLMTEFFSEFSNLGTEPENTTIRNVLVQKAISLSEAFRSRQEGLQGVQKSLRSDLKSTVHQINQISREIADVNRKISAAGNMIGNANDLKDRRDLLLDRLSEYVNIRYTENNNGQLTVSTAGQTLVSGNEYRELTAKTADDNDRIKVSIKGSNNQNLAIGGGKLGGLLQIHNQTIFGIEDQLNKLAKNFIEEVNRLHQSGRGLGSQQSDP
ncbi:MAG: flagellar hook-associated protein FlgK, partial [candidate division Zixibacteria bacterium]|nr:flagellar hook-associated protein FlgK [candidate division KSB1 bacterium]NIS48749.1 flagellar hook-associated protein FlgK [candidate division Zixibacteria bacterium]NIV08979.1 flagellar hook-associated protein FlgK [candidate division Zixibacteria bacterium]NIW22426.1 flagellar hook-associated protein FlgK [candidate division KSB1 bacterium]NIW73049.1 flagellar hook-associated protein FlgK [candidate division KSB1 bacterium]